MGEQEKYIFETNNGARARIAEAAARMRKITRDETDRKRIQSLWVNVKDRLPSEKCNVLVWFSHNNTMAVAYRLRGQWWGMWSDYTLSKVTHWMPLPEPPKEDET